MTTEPFVYAHHTPTGYAIELCADDPYFTLVRRRYVKTEQHAKRIAYLWLDNGAREFGQRLQVRGLARRWARESGWQSA